MLRLAVIGCGARAASLVRLLTRVEPDVRLVAVADPDEVEARRRLGGREISLDECRFYPDVDGLLQHADQYDGLMLGTRCHLHTPLAVRAAASGLPMYLEKPVAITREQLQSLWQACSRRDSEFVVSFPLRNTPVFKKTMEIIQSGRLGTINQVQAVNNVPYGGVYYGNWYRSFDETGGLWLQKATHDFDAINQIVGAMPKTIAATETQRIYAGDMPDDLQCVNCDRTEVCIESPQNIVKRGDGGGMDWGKDPKNPHNHWCAFSKSIRHMDAGSAMIQYENGIHAAYSQNFVSRRSAGRRGAVIIGYSATLEFYYHSHKIRVIDHHGTLDRVEEMTIHATGGHGGGDEVLLHNFVQVMRREAPSNTPLSAGILSAAMCLAARESAETNRFVNVELPESAARSPRSDTALV